MVYDELVGKDIQMKWLTIKLISDSCVVQGELNWVTVSFLICLDLFVFE